MAGGKRKEMACGGLQGEEEIEKESIDQAIHPSERRPLARARDHASQVERGATRIAN